MRPIEIFISVGFFTIIGLLFIYPSTLDSKIDECRKTCGDKKFIYAPPHTERDYGNTMGTLKLQDCICIDKTSQNQSEIKTR
jgi:hypothetical protein